MSINIDDVLQFAGENQKRRPKGGGGDFYTIKKDRENSIRILEIGKFIVGQHWNFVQGRNGQASAIRCPQTYDGSPCPICEMAAHKLSIGASKDEVRKYKAQEKYPMLVLDMNEPEPRALKIFEAPVTVFDSLVNLIEGEDYRHILDFKKGHNLNIKLKKEGNFSKYFLTPKLQSTSVDVDQATFPNLREVLRPNKSYEEIEFAMSEGHFPESEGDSRPARPLEDDVYYEGEAEEIQAKQEPAPTAYRRGLPSTKLKEDEPQAPVHASHVPVLNPALAGARSQNREALRGKLHAMKKGPVAALPERT